MEGEIVFITDAWGAKHGGINSFNQDLCSALAKLLEDKYRIGCIVLDATEAEILSAREKGVALIKLDSSEQNDKFEENRVYEVLEKVKDHNFGNVLWWIGHDVFTGQIAITASKKSHSGQSAVIHHMNYEAYAPFKERYGGDEGHYENKNSEGTRIKIKEQRYVLLHADVVFAVGPKLHKSATDKIRGSKKQVVELIPGLAEIEGLETPEIFSAITYGRLDSRNDRNKQGSLVVEAFGQAKSISYDPLGYDAKLFVIGLPLDKQQEESAKIRKLVEIQANRAVDIIPLPYMEDRDELFELLRQQSVCLMVSLHEGFGLVGWEAIAAEVPLIVSKNSGLYDAINNLLGGSGLGCLKTIDIKGSHADKPYREEDIENVAKLLIEIKTSFEESKKNAKRLKELLNNCTWQNTALELAKACNLKFTRSLAPKNGKKTGLKYVSEISGHSTRLIPKKNENEKAEEKVNQELIDLGGDTKRLDSNNHIATDTLEYTEEGIDYRLKTILENSEVLFIGEGVSEKSGIRNLRVFIVEIIESITEHQFSRIDCDELRKNIRSESAFRILYNELGDDILIFFEQFIKCEPNDLHYYLANEIKKGKWIFTTNIDNLIEEACRRSSIEMDNKIIYNYDGFGEFYSTIQGPKTLPVGCIFKLNGTIEEKKVGSERFESLIFSLNPTGNDLNLNKIKVLKYFLKNFDFCFMGYDCLDDFGIYPNLKYTPTEKAIFWFNYEKKPFEIISEKRYLEAEIGDEEYKRFRDVETLYINHILSKRKSFLKISGNWMEFIQKKYCSIIDINRDANLSQIQEKKTSAKLPKLCGIINNYQKNIIIGRLWEECLSKDKAIICFEEAENLGEGKYKAKAKLSLARVYDMQYGISREKNVIMKYHEAFEIYETHGIITEAAQCKIRLANFKRRALKQFNEACKDCGEAKQMLDLVEKKDDTFKMASAEYFNCLGLIYSKLGRDFVSKCDDLFKSSLKYRKELGDFEGVAKTENAIGLTKRNKQNKNIEEIYDAIWHLDRAQKINESIGNYRGITQNFRNLGLCYTDLINLDENNEAKIVNFQKAKECYENSVSYWYIMKGDPPVEDLLECQYRLGELEVNHGDINEGIKFLNKVEEEYNKKEIHWHNRARTLDLLCKAFNSNDYLDTKGIEDAKATIEKILSIYKKILNDQSMQRKMIEDKEKFRNANEILGRMKKTIRKLGLKDEYFIIECDNIVDNLDEILEKLKNIMNDGTNNISINN